MAKKLSRFVGVMLDPNTVQTIQDVARAKGTTMSTVIRRSLLSGLRFE